MSDDNDLIRRGDARKIAIAYSEGGKTAEKAGNAITALPAVGVGVRDLEWDETSEKIPKPAWVSATGFGRWFIVLDFIAINHAVYRIHGLDYQTIEAAKAAAQADYEARIRSALIVTPAPDAAKVAALVEAAKACNDRGAQEEQAYGLTRGTQNFYRARDVVKALRDKPAPAVTVQEAAKALLAEWQDSKTTQADDIAQDEADTHQPDDFDASKIVEVWLRAIAGGGDE